MKIKLMVFILSLVILSQSIFAIDSSVLSDIESKYKCDNDSERVRVLYNTSGADSNKVFGYFEEGKVNGKVTNSYLGVSAFNDLMFVDRLNKEKDSNKNRFNVTISMCPQSMVSLGMVLPLIGEERRLKSFKAPSGIILRKGQSIDGLGIIEFALNTFMISEAFKYSVNGVEGTLDDFEISTSFFAPRSYNH